VMGRVVATKLSRAWPAGGGGQPRRRGRHARTGAAVRAAPDGYTLAFAAPSTHVSGPLVFPTRAMTG
jgi:hypothetical protein